MTTRVKPAENGVVQSLSDSVVLTPPSRGFIIGKLGDISVRMSQNKETVVLPNMAAGVIHAIAADRFHTTGTGTIGTLVVVW